jgi:catechol 2,3-dioxygenase
LWAGSCPGCGAALFAHFRDPDGHRLEVFNTHYQVMDIENEPVRWDLSALRQRSWGLPPRRRWSQEASRFLGLEPREPPRQGDPMTLVRFSAGER